MEYMPLSLNDCLEKYEDIPLSIKYQILLDVCLGLRFMHEQDPPIIHRDLTANNVMLTADMRAKITDLGQAKVVDIQMKAMTTAPGTLSYMPPEALVHSPKYDVTLDIFSFGVLIVHTTIQRLPMSMDAASGNGQKSLDQFDSETEKRKASWFEQIGESNALTPLAKHCLNDDPKLRPQRVSSIVANLRKLASQCQPTFKNSLEAIKMLDESKARVASHESSLQDAEVQIEAILQDIQPTDLANRTRISLLEKQLKSISNEIQASLNQKEIQRVGRLAVVYHHPKHKELNLPVKIGHCQVLHDDSQHTTLVKTPINIRFTGTHCKTIFAGLKRPMSVAVSGEGLVYVCDTLGWKAVHIYNPNDADNIKTMVDST